MRLLSRYICRYYLRFFWLGLGGSAALLLIAELFDRLDEFIGRQVLWSDAVSYLGFKMVGLIFQAVPAAFLLASVVTFSTLNKSNEITAMRASGVAPLRLALPLFGLGVIGGMVFLGAQEFLVPYANRAYRAIWSARISVEKRPLALGRFDLGSHWYRRDNRIWHVGRSQPLEGRLFRVTIYVLNASGGIRHRYEAAEARWEAGEWVLLRGSRRSFRPDGSFAGAPEEFAQRHLAFPEAPREIIAKRRELDELSSREVLAQSRWLRRQGISALRYLTEFYGRFAYAAACVIMAGFGMSLALGWNRSGGTGRAIGLTLLWGFGYWAAHSIAMALGYNGYLPPMLAAWGTNLGFGSCSVYMAYRLR
jgi:lipopolysaccharide export system permease protein